MKTTSRIRSLPRNVFVAGLVSLAMDASSEMVYPLVPLFLTGVLGTTRTTVGLIEGVAEATASVLKVFSGWISDRLGKRKLLMGLGYAISTLSRPAIGMSTRWAEVLGARFVDRFGKGVRTAPRDAIIAESTAESKLGTAFGFHRAMDTVGAIIGPALAFSLLFFFPGDLRLVFFASTVPGVAAVLLIVFFIRERAPEREEDPNRGEHTSPMSFDGPFRWYMASIGIFSLGTFSDAFIILRAEDLGVAPALVPVVYLLFNVVYAVSAAPLGSLADTLGLRRMVAAGFVYFAAVFALLGLATTEYHIWVLFPLYGVFKGMSDGTQRAYLATLVPAHVKATAFGAYHTVVGLALLPASVIAGYLWDAYGPRAAFFYGAALALVAAAVFLIGARRSANRRSW